MSAFISSKFSWALKRVTQSVSVANDPVAKLMYYMNCVACVLKVEEENINRLKDYENYHDISAEEVDSLLSLCLKYRPDILENECFYNDKDLCPNFSNEFYELSAAKSELAGVVTESTVVVVAGHASAIIKFMTYKPFWMDKNYYTPMKRLKPWQDAMKSNAQRPMRKCGVRIQPKDPFADM